MGTFQSKPTALTRDQLLRSTDKSRDFTNKLFQVMITKLTPEDFLKLGNPQMCNSYIFMMADSIQKLFQDLRIRPKQDKDTGVVLFQKVDTLRAQTPQAKELCLIISYFYIRIFQLFGALAMTILDDPGAGQILGATRYSPPSDESYSKDIFGIQRQRQRRRFPGSRPAPLYGGAREEYFKSGKVLNLRPLRSLFDNPHTDFSSRGNPRIIFPFYDFPNMFYIPDRVDSSSKSQNLVIDLESAKLYGNILLETINRDTSYLRYKISLANFILKDTDLDTEILTKINRYLSKYTAQFTTVSSDNGYTWMVSETKTIVDKLENVIQDIQKNIEKIKLNPQLPDTIEKNKSSAHRDVGVPKALQNQYIIDALKSIAGKKTVAFCIARAFQLLDANSQFQRIPQKAISGVCTARFEELPLSVPQLKTPISSVPGLKALGQLYYTKVGLSVKDETVLGIEDQAEYAEFLKQMIGLFGSSGSTPTSFDAILAKDPNCPATAIKHYLQIQDPKSIEKIMKIVYELFGKQLAHTKRVIQFFHNRLFYITKQSGSSVPYIDIHPKLLQGGIDELAKVSKEVREILINYYKDCETIYQKGAQEVLQSRFVAV